MQRVCYLILSFLWVLSNVEVTDLWTVSSLSKGSSRQTKVILFRIFIFSRKFYHSPQLDGTLSEHKLKEFFLCNYISLFRILGFHVLPCSGNNDNVMVIHFACSTMQLYGMIIAASRFWKPVQRQTNPARTNLWEYFGQRWRECRWRWQHGSCDNEEEG